jgi:hypothetical protein
LKKTLFQYDSSGNLGSSDDYRGDSVISSFRYKYDERKNKIEEIKLYGKKEEWRFVYAYNNGNKLIREEHNYPFKTSNSVTENVYDKSGNLISEIVYDYKNTVMQRRDYKYLEGKLLSQETNNTSIEMEYDSSGARKKETVKSQGKIISEKFFKKDTIVLWKHYTTSGIYDYQEIFEFDPLTNRLLKYNKVEKNGNIVERSVYVYDEYGHEIEQTYYQDGVKPTWQKVTKYTYYALQ